MKRIYVVLSMLGLALGLYSNSIFSRHGMPEAFYGVDVYGVGAGYTGLSDLYRSNGSFTNPSLAVTTNTVMMSGSFSLGLYDYRSKNEGSFTDDGMMLSGFGAMVPVYSHRFGIYGHPFLGGNLENKFTKNIYADDDTLSMTETHKVEANIYQADLFYAWDNPWVNIGISANYYIGSHFYYIEQNYDSDLYLDTKIEVAHYYENPGFTIGLSKKFDRFSVGLTYSSKARLIGDTKLTTIYNSEPLDDGQFTIPQRIAGGITLQPWHGFKCSLESEYQLWKDVKTDYTTWDVQTSHGIEDNHYQPVNVDNSLRLSLGLAYDPVDKHGRWYTLLPLRVGVSYRNLPFKSITTDASGAVISSHSIDETAFTGGFSIPLPSEQQELNISFEYITRGTIENNDYADHTYLVSVSAVGFDIFSKRKKKIEHRDIPMPDESGN